MGRGQDMVAYGEYIQIFGLEYFIYIAGLLLFAFLLFSFREKARQYRDILTKIILITSICQQILLYGSYFVLMEFDLSESLPLHISRINTILGIIYLVTKDKKLYKVLCYFGMFAWTSFLYPSRVYGITHPIGISFFVNHVITILLPYYGMISYNEKIEKGDKKKAFLWFIAYLVFIYFFNPLVDGNYFYLKYKPFLSDLPDYIYIPGSMLFTYGLFSLGEFLFLKFGRRLRVNEATQKEDFNGL